MDGVLFCLHQWLCGTNVCTLCVCASSQLMSHAYTLWVDLHVCMSVSHASVCVCVCVSSEACVPHVL